MEKQPIEGEKKPFGKRTILLTSWASVATALFLLVVIGGAIYLNDVRSECDLKETDDGEAQTKTVRYTIREDEEDEDEEVYIDDKLKTQLFIKRNKEGAITLIADIDYDRKISATYLAEINQCLLSSGEELDWFQAWNPPEETDSIPERTEENTHNFKADPDNRVTDMSLLPRYIRPFCEGKEIYWTTPASDDELEEGKSEVGREKRGLRCRFYCYWRWWSGWWCGWKCTWTWGK